MTTVKQKYTQATDLEHMRNQTAMYLGGKAVTQSREYCFNKSKNWIELQKTRLSPAALKCFDEILVNAIDQYTLHGSDIWITIDPDNTCTITNNRSSIELYETETRDGRKMWSPQLILGEFKTGSNLDTSQDSTTGGVFGIGSKGVNAFSETFEVETYDPKSDQLYFQQWHNCMQRVDPPEIEKNPADKDPFVRITFLLNFEDFGMAGATDVLATFHDLCYMRALHTAVFCNSKVYWQNEVLKTCTPDALARLYMMPHFEDPNKIESITFCMTNAKRLKWTVTLATKDNKENMEQVSVINGIYVKKGTHIDSLTDQIVEYVKPLWIELKDPSKKASKASKSKSTLATIREDKAKAKLAKNTSLYKELAALEKDLKAKEATGPKFDKRYVEKYLFIQMMAHINRPGFTGQRKDEIDSPAENFAEYRIPEARLKEFWALLRPWIEFDIFTKAADQGASSRAKKKLVKPKKYCPAKFAGTKNRDRANLFIGEGDSAIGTLDKGIASKLSPLTYEEYGLFSIGGVPMNARKEITLKTNPKTGETLMVRSARLKENERLTALVAVLDLDYTKTYRLQGERNDLPYRHVILSCDQDQDGAGNIRSQLFNFFWTFWPELVKAGFVQFMITPVIRAFHKRGKQTVREFYTEKEYKKWVDQLTEDVSDAWEVVYYKGLGSHGQGEIENMFSKFEQLLITYTWDKRTEDACEVYFGEDTDLRKIVLKKPSAKTENDYYVHRDGLTTVSATDHLNTETRSYQIYNIARHIKHVIDGGLPSKRKIWFGARKKLQHNNQRIKVYQLAGEIAKSMNYHHGDMSLNSGITGAAQDYPGACEFPMLLPLSNFGSRKKGGSDAGSARYIYTKLNKALSDALFPPVDDYLYDYTFDDGHRGEPVFAVPVVPLAILESYSSPGTGWKCGVWARDYWEVSAWVRACCTSGVHARGSDFSFTKNRFKHTVMEINGTENSVGTYTRCHDTLTITELPVRVWNEHFLNGNPDTKDSKGVADRDYIVDAPVDSSTDTEINIELKFQEGFLQNIPSAKEGELDPIIKLLDLKQSLKPQLNFVGTNGAVQEFTRYTEIFDLWFVVRKQYYQKRIERMTVLLALRATMITEQIKFVKIRETLDIAGKRTAAQNVILAAQGFIKFNRAVLDKPSYTPIPQLEEIILRSAAASHDYLRKMDSDDLSEEGLEILEKRLKETLADLAELRAPDAAKKIQLKELDALDVVVKRGQTQGWMSWEPKQLWESI